MKGWKSPMKKIMMLGAGPLQVPAIKKAKETGYYVIVADQNPNAEGFLYADLSIVVSTRDEEGIYQHALIHQPDFIMTSTSDAPVKTVAWVNEKLGVKTGLSYADALCVTNKMHMRERLEQHGIPMPKYAKVHSAEEFESVIVEFADKFVLKPVDNAGSRGVALIDKKNVDGLQKAYSYSQSFSNDSTLLVEEYLQGYEVSVEAFTVDGETEILAITDKVVSNPPYFVELGHSIQSQLDDETKKDIIHIVKRTIAAVNIRNGPSHTELKITKEGPKVIEIAARLGGDFITSKLVPLSTGIDMVGLSILSTVGQEIRLAQRSCKGAAIRFILPPDRAGKVSGLTGVEEAKRVQGIYEVELYKTIGENVVPLESSNDRLGHIIAVGENATEAIDMCEAALKKIKVNFAR